MQRATRLQHAADPARVLRAVTVPPAALPQRRAYPAVLGQVAVVAVRCRCPAHVPLATTVQKAPRPAVACPALLVVYVLGALQHRFRAPLEGFGAQLDRAISPRVTQDTTASRRLILPVPARGRARVPRAGFAPLGVPPLLGGNVLGEASALVVLRRRPHVTRRDSFALADHQTLAQRHARRGFSEMGQWHTQQPRALGPAFVEAAATAPLGAPLQPHLVHHVDSVATARVAVRHL